jgi:hypothetical protein
MCIFLQVSALLARESLNLIISYIILLPKSELIPQITIPLYHKLQIVLQRDYTFVLLLRTKIMKNAASIITALGYLVGGIGGFVYYKLFPCEGGCTITSSPLITIMIGAFIGGFISQVINLSFNSKS